MRKFSTIQHMTRKPPESYSPGQIIFREFWPGSRMGPIGVPLSVIFQLGPKIHRLLP